MKKLVYAVGTVLLMAFSFDASEVVVTGTLVDTKCYGMDSNNTGNSHGVPMENGEMGEMPNCATACAAMGIPVGVLEGGKSGGKVHIIIAPAGTFAEHMAKQVRVKGEIVFPGSIMPEKVEVKGDDGWTEVQIVTMM
ncbi:MAG: hypothetical protein HKN43_06460 [Rhodothermales bacterium]|nr:hypothetical protein [Rhodothermales bacterium]